MRFRPDIHFSKYPDWNLLVASTRITMPIRHSPRVIAFMFPCRTKPDERFLIKEGRYVMAEGKAYEIQNLRFHEVHDEGARDCWHLIFDYLSPQ